MLQKTLLESKRENSSCLIDLYGQDFVYGVTRGKILTEKYFMVLGMHNLTGQKSVVEL